MAGWGVLNLLHSEVCRTYSKNWAMQRVVASNYQRLVQVKRFSLLYGKEVSVLYLVLAVSLEVLSSSKAAALSTASVASRVLEFNYGSVPSGYRSS